MIINTENKRVQFARESILEFLLVNHPLDCPICDQGGECDLQDITLVFGSDRGRFYDLKKRAIDNLNCAGPLIKTIMTRCIHCTRCVRFLYEVAGNLNLGVIGRGNNMEIGTFIEASFFEELTGNIIDLCPVGASTSMPYAFTARSWELLKINSIDVMDALGSAIRVDIVNNKVMRILPRLDENVNEEWITNKARFVYDSLSIQRINFPKLKYNLKFFVISWNFALHLLIDFLISFMYNINIEAVIGPFVDLETAFSLKNFFFSMGCFNINFIYNLKILLDYKFLYLLNLTLEELEFANLIFLIGCNLRYESPLILTRIRKSFLNDKTNFNIFSLGLALNTFSFKVKNLGNSVRTYKKFLEGKLENLNQIFNFKFFLLNLHFFYKKVVFFFGMNIILKIDAISFIKSFLYFLSFLKLNSFFWKNFNIIASNLGILSGFEFNLFSNKMKSETNLLYLINADSYENLNVNNFIVYQNHFANSSFLYYKADLLLPSMLYLEKTASYLNMEGRYRISKKGIIPFNFIFSDFDIIQVLNILRRIKIIQNFSILDNFFDILNYFKKVISYECLFFYNITKFFLKLKHAYFLTEPFYGFAYDSLKNFFDKFYNKQKIINIVFLTFINNYYKTDIFCRNSKILSLCSLKNTQYNFIK